MSTLDVVNQVGGTAANFLDIGGGANADVMAAALEVINFDENVKSIFINIFGGITRGEEVAKGIVEALRSRRPAGADRDPPRRHQRRGGPRRSWPTPASPSRSSPPSPPCSKRPAPPSPSRTGATDMAIFVDADTKVIVQGLTGGQGKYHGLRNQAYGTQVVGGVTPGQGRPGRRGHPGLRHGRRGRRRHRRRPRRSSPCRRRPRRRRSSRRPRPASASSCASPRASRPRTRPRCSTRWSATIPAPACSARTARASSAPASATSASPPARSPSCRPPAAPTSASSAARARSPTRRCTS